MEYHRAKIAFIIDQFDGPTAGTERQLLALINGLKCNSEFEASLIVLRNSEYLRSNSFPCPVYRLNLQKLFHYKALTRGIQLSSYLRRNNISIAHNFFPDSLIFCPFFCKLAGLKVVASRRDLGFLFTSKQLSLLKISNLLVDVIIANSKLVKESILENEGDRFKNKIRVIYNGFDIGKFGGFPDGLVRQKLDIPSHSQVIGMVANFNLWKRHEDLLKAFLFVHKTYTDSYLVLVGDGERMQDVRYKADSFGLKESVKFLGKVDNVLPVLQDCSVCVLCSETEGFSNALIEYMGCGKPVVATAVGGNTELVEDGITGYIVPVGDTKALADRIITVLQDTELAKRMGLKGAERVRQNFGLARMIEAYVSLYKDLL